MARCTHMFVYVVSWLDFAVLLVPDTTSHHFVWFPYPEQPEGVMVLVRLCVSRETWHSTRFPAAFLYSYRTRRLRQCNRNPGIFSIYLSFPSTFHHLAQAELWHCFVFLYGTGADSLQMCVCVERYHQPIFAEKDESRCQNWSAIKKWTGKRNICKTDAYVNMYILIPVILS